MIGETSSWAGLARFPKVARQHALAAQGLPVPEGAVLELGRARQLFSAVGLAAAADDRETEDLALAWARAQFEAGHRVIVRSAGLCEDGEHSSGAGLGMSVAGLESPRAIGAALTMIATHERATGGDDPGGEQTLILLQREIQRRALLVVVRGVGAPDYVEVHGPDAGPEPLAEGRDPDWAGPLREWGDDSRGLVEALIDTVAAQEAGPHGVDLELVVDPRGDPWLVQARPLTAALHPSWPEFLAAVEAEREDTRHPDPRMRGRLTLDGEHNPTPLSPAHAWVMGRLRHLRPTKAGDPVVLAGWLYMRALPRELGPADTLDSATQSATVDMDASEALLWLRDTALPRARRALEDFDASLLAEGGMNLEAGLAAAEALFLGMIDDYIDRLVPARRRALAATRMEAESTATTSVPLTLLDRDAFLDVLPAAWDIASPSLAELLTGTRPTPPARVALPTGARARAQLLGEWDDHLFALGLAPLRRLWLYAATRLSMRKIDRVFLLSGDELVALDRDPRALGDARARDRILDDRARTWNRHAELDPPTRIVDGQPVPLPVGGYLRGLAIGEPFSGPVVQRRDLRDLLTDPPAAGTVLCMPALTAQAAVALEHLGVRAVCTEYGGALAHGALMARELGLSALIGCRGCTRLSEGQAVHLDTRSRRLVPL